MTDFEQAMENARYWAKDGVVETSLNDMAAAHAVVVAERDSYRDVAHKLARYVLPDSDTLTIRQLVDAADAVCEAAEEDPNGIQA